MTDSAFRTGRAHSLADHLSETRLAGWVATPIVSCLVNCRRLASGDPDASFGLSDWRHVTYDEVVALVESCGVALGGAAPEGEEPDGPAWIEPAAAVEAIFGHRDHLARLAANRSRVLLATGHAFALLPHYGALARALADAGCSLLRPLDGKRDEVRLANGEPASIRYFDGVATLAHHGALLHTHRPHYMHALLDAVGGPQGVDAVIADHGFAGAAVEAGITTLSIADANDPALPLAQARGRTDGVLIIDDGLTPSLFEPVTAAMLEWAR